jgi:protein-L-isoaspartate(D-aspartate) O-methyltransferase
MNAAWTAASSLSEMARRTMVDCQIRTFDVTDGPVLARFLAVPRELFLPQPLAALAYSDTALKFQTDVGPRWLLPPLILARLLQGAGIARTDRVLDVAPAGGYSTALLAGLARDVVALESEPALAAALRGNLAAVGADNVDVREGPLERGAADAGPFDVILVNGGVEAGLDMLLAQLAPRGRLVAVQVTDVGRGTRFERIGGEVSSRTLFDATAVVLAPFRKTPAFVF